MTDLRIEPPETLDDVVALAHTLRAVHGWDVEDAAYLTCDAIGLTTGGALSDTDVYHMRRIVDERVDTPFWTMRGTRGVILDWHRDLYQLWREAALDKRP